MRCPAIGLPGPAPAAPSCPTDREAPTHLAPMDAPWSAGALSCEGARAGVAMLDYPRRDLHPGDEAELLPHAVDVGFHRPNGDVQPDRDLLVRQTDGDQPHHLPLAGGKRSPRVSVADPRGPPGPVGLAERVGCGRRRARVDPLLPQRLRPGA